MIKGNRSFMQGLLTTHTVSSCCGLQMMYSNNHCIQLQMYLLSNATTVSPVNKAKQQEQGKRST